MAQLAIGLVYDLLGSYPRRPGDPPDAEAEYEPEATLLGLEDAIRRLGHRPVRLGRPADLLEAAGKGQVVVDAALTIAEGHGSRNREAWAPVLLEMLAIPQLGSDALTLSLSLDKAWTRAVVAEVGVPVAPAAVVRSAAEAQGLDPPGGFPCFVKPRWEGTAKGITARSRVEDRDALVGAVTRVLERYGQPALVEHFLPGAEYTVTVVGHAPPRPLPVLQRALDARTRIGVHALAAEGGDELEPCTPGTLDPALEAGLEELALRAFKAMECRDFARLDFKLNAKDRPVFLEINPLPTFAPDGSFGILAELEGRSHAELVAEVIGAALERLGLAP
jgi:D-alanine-D-alanine ligase